MTRIDNGYGGTDERAMIAEFHRIHGVDTAEKLDRLLKSSYPGIRVSAFDKPATAREVFERRAKRDGYSDAVIADFRLISS